MYTICLHWTLSQSPCTAISHYSRADSRLAPSQWETSFQSTAVSYWLGANLESTLYRAVQRFVSGLWKMWVMQCIATNPKSVADVGTPNLYLKQPITQKVTPISPVAQSPHCTSLISHNAPLCNRNVHVCTFLLQSGALWEICLMHHGICELSVVWWVINAS